MSRIAKNPITLPSGVSLNQSGNEVSVKGSKGTLQLKLHQSIKVVQDDGVVKVVPVSEGADGWAMAGTHRALLSNMVIGVSEGFSKTLRLIGVGYRAQMKGNILNMNLGFSHPVDYPVPDGITITAPTQTDVIVSGIDKQQVGQVAAEIRAFRPPEPYKGKGVRYSDEYVLRKEAKKK
ncbi:MAG: 50S ribosomal protein L6 [Chromatiaceae bacterium]|nr:50S ribosomal protein L6 [Gammaproteobacteria bacterium]MCP5426954.1 50S ribosomal protein L6 [Chromatiaceae bacterium]MCB1861216.1 50S ribosomal protein L6 [Gammaproteobacteria bacterium]MCB1871081.1 50S ribosomal protein L6 [Gammaproteobacteria bacterium]MCB1878850.1 50S ribosomal protein L6 [Gammaproteobacteria bacterium]